MKLRKYLRILPAVIALASSAEAIQINWGSDVDSVLMDSFGVPIDQTFAVQLGFFEGAPGVPFVPNASNVNDWSSHWRVFDQASAEQLTFDPASGYFTSSASLGPDGGSDSLAADLGVDFSEKTAYVWVYNSKAAVPGSEWFLATAPAWQTPAKVDDCCDNRTPLEWSISDLTPSDVPVYGRQGDATGAGAYANTGNYTLQTFTFVPEPSSSLLLILGGLVVTLQRRRTKP